MVLLFEDSPNTPSSLLLKKCLYGSNIAFSGANSALASCAKKFRDEGHKVIIFVDLPVNNDKAKVLYDSLSEMYEDDEDIIVLPIVCIEYYILKMLSDHGFLDFDTYYFDNDISSLITNFVTQITGEPIDKSIEKQYKYILSEIGRKNHCYINKSINTNKYINKSMDTNKKSLRGRFYTCGCPCDNKYCKVCLESSVGYKAECLYSSLPVFFIDNKYRGYISKTGLNLNIHPITLECAFNKLVELHTHIYNLYGSGGMPVFRFNYAFRLGKT